MKKLFSFVVALVATVAAFAQQPTGVLSVAPKVGLNLAYMTAAENGKMRPGLAAGVDLTYQFSEKFALSGGLFYSQQGVKSSETAVDIQDGIKVNMDIDHVLKNDYFNVPILANYYVAPGLALKAGVQLGALLSAKRKSDIHATAAGISFNTSEEEDMKDSYNSLDFSIPVGLSYEISNVIIDARYNIGVTKSVKSEGGFDVEGTRNNVIMLTVGYKFNL